MQELLNNPTVQYILVLVGLYVLYRFWTRSESFAEVASGALADEGTKMETKESDKEILIKPAYVQEDVRSLMAGSGFMPQPEFVAPWDQGVVNVVDAQYGIADGLDDGAGGSLGLNYNLCDSACCSEQWPTPFKLPYNKFICENKDKFASSPYTCSNQWNNAGCLCMSKTQHKFLVNRGGNA
jgi:hypothetical protein